VDVTATRAVNPDFLTAFAELVCEVVFFLFLEPLEDPCTPFSRCQEMPGIDRGCWVLACFLVVSQHEERLFIGLPSLGLSVKGPPLWLMFTYDGSLKTRVLRA
jgi:hypothetical protein